MKAWTLTPSGEGTVLEIPRHKATERACEIIGASICLTYVMWQGKRCRMAVDDEGHIKGLPFNEAATQAYWRACTPGTTHTIVGTAVIFEGATDL
jgi:hypothetical protein